MKRDKPKSHKYYIDISEIQPNCTYGARVHFSLSVLFSSNSCGSKAPQIHPYSTGMGYDFKMSSLKHDLILQVHQPYTCKNRSTMDIEDSTRSTSPTDTNLHTQTKTHAISEKLFAAEAIRKLKGIEFWLSSDEYVAYESDRAKSSYNGSKY